MNTYQPFAAVSQLPAALRFPQKKHALEHWRFYKKWTSFTETCVKFIKLSTKHSFWELARGARGIPGSGVSKCCSDPPFYTRRGSG